MFISGLQVSVLAQNDGPYEHFIFWDEDNDLEWVDFDGLAERYSDHGAYSFTGFMTEYRYSNGKHYALVRTYFDQELSWTKTWTNLLLRHEQGHFDIAEITAREFRAEVQQRMENRNMNATIFDSLRAEAIKKLNERQKEYDYSTDYSLDFQAQEKWDHKIEQRLQSLSQYIEPVITVEVR
jgi:hypothetical protein